MRETEGNRNHLYLTQITVFEFKKNGVERRIICMYTIYGNVHILFDEISSDRKKFLKCGCLLMVYHGLFQKWWGDWGEYRAKRRRSYWRDMMQLHAQLGFLFKAQSALSH